MRVTRCSRYGAATCNWRQTHPCDLKHTAPQRSSRSPAHPNAKFSSPGVPVAVEGLMALSAAIPPDKMVLP